MKKNTIVVLVLIFLLIASGLFIYFKVILPNRQSSGIDLVNLSISAEYLNEKIQTGFEINGERINISKTYEVITVPKNRLTIIKNINLEDQTFYSREVQINFSKNERYDFILEKPSEIEISFDKSNPINIKVIANLENSFICLAYSPAYIFVRLENYSETSIERYKKWDKCYQIGNIKNQDFEVTYTEFNKPTEKDYINFSIGLNEFPELDKIIKIQ